MIKKARDMVLATQTKGPMFRSLTPVGRHCVFLIVSVSEDKGDSESKLTRITILV